MHWADIQAVLSIQAVLILAAVASIAIRAMAQRSAKLVPVRVRRRPAPRD